MWPLIMKLSSPPRTATACTRPLAITFGCQNRGTIGTLAWSFHVFALRLSVLSMSSRHIAREEPPWSTCAHQDSSSTMFKCQTQQFVQFGQGLDSMWNFFEKTECLKPIEDFSPEEGMGRPVISKTIRDLSVA